MVIPESSRQFARDLDGMIEVRLARRFGIGYPCDRKQTQLGLPIIEGTGGPMNCPVCQSPIPAALLVSERQRELGKRKRPAAVGKRSKLVPCTICGELCNTRDLWRHKALNHPKRKRN